MQHKEQLVGTSGGSGNVRELRKVGIVGHVCSSLLLGVAWAGLWTFCAGIRMVNFAWSFVPKRPQKKTRVVIGALPFIMLDGLDFIANSR